MLFMALEIWFLLLIFKPTPWTSAGLRLRSSGYVSCCSDTLQMQGSFPLLRVLWLEAGHGGVWVGGCGVKEIGKGYCVTHHNFKSPLASNSIDNRDRDSWIVLPKIPEKERGKHSWIYFVVVGPSWWVVLRYPVKTCRSNEETSEEGRPTTAAWVDPEKEMIMLLFSLTPWHTPRRRACSALTVEAHGRSPPPTLEFSML